MSVPREHREHAPKQLKFALLIVSTSRYSGRGDEDLTTPLVEGALRREGHTLIYKRTVPDEIDAIREAVLDLIRDVDVLIISGGSGLTKSDVTPEAVRPLISKEIPGFGELFRFLSYKQVGSAAMASRAFAGVVYDSLVFALPGSPDAVRLALENLILPESSHLIYMIRSR